MIKLTKSSFLPSGLAMHALGAFLLPLLALFLFATYSLFGTASDVYNARRAVALTEANPVISNVIYHLQRERGMSSGFVGTYGGSFENVLASQRANTDIAVEEFIRYFQSHEPNLPNAAITLRLNRAYGALLEITQIRKTVDLLNLPLFDLVGQYSQIIDDLLSVHESLVKTVDNPDLIQKNTAYIALIKAKEYAGIERAMGSVGFGNGQFETAVYNRFVELNALQKANLDSYHKLAKQAFASLLEDIEKSEDTKRIESLRALVHSKPAQTQIEANISGPEWFFLSSQRIDALHQLETQQSVDVENAARHLYQKFLFIFWRNILVITSLIFIVVYVIIRVMRNVVAPIDELSHTMQRVALLETGLVIPHLNKDGSVGKIAQSLEVLRQNTHRKIELSQEIEARNRLLEGNERSHRLF